MKSISLIHQNGTRYKKNILENATITQKNGVTHLYDAIKLSEKGIYTGKINIKNTQEPYFKEHSFIPRDQVNKITIFSKDGTPQDIDW